MGVPITFLDKYCPEQFEIIGFSLLNCKPIRECIPATDTYDKGGLACYLTVNKTHHKRLYGRIFIRNKYPNRTDFDAWQREIDAKYQSK